MATAQVKVSSMVEDERVQILMDLGLTLLQAKIYLALSQTGKATIATVSKTAHVARQDTYRIMPTLEKLGLAEKIIAAPMMYNAIPIKEGYYLLLQNKTREQFELKKKTMDMIKKAHESNGKAIPKEEVQQFFLISSKELFEKKADLEDSRTQTILDIIGSWKGLSSWIFDHLQTYERALKRGVKIRIITEKHEDKKSMREISPTFKNNPLFEVRYITGPLPIKTAINDGKTANLGAGRPEDGELTPSLWSNNPQFVKVMTAYFEELWNKADLALF